MIMIMSNKHRLKHNQDGFASIVIALVLILVLSLLTVGFAQLARREQQTALDKQLAGQAYYAAESGINDAVLGIQGNTKAGIPPTITSGTPNVNTNNCLNAPFITNGASSLSNTYGVSYSCVLVNLQPPSIQYDNVGPGSDRYLSFTTTSTGATSDFTVQWVSTDGQTNYPNDPSTGFQPAGSWNHGPVLQVSITPLTNTSRQALTTNTMTAVLYPAQHGTNAASYSSYTLSPYAASSVVSNEGKVISGRCSTATAGYQCQATISGVPGGTGPFLIHLYNMPYDTANVNINGQSAGVPIKFIDGQAIVDSTGKDKNVSKRLLVHIPINPDYPVPNFSVEGQSVCKRFDTLGGSTTPDTSISGCDFN